MKKFLKAVLVFFLLCMVVIFIGISMLIFKYRGWRNSFESNLNPEYISESYDEIPVELQEKFFGFVSSSEKSDFIEISVSDFSDLLYFVANQQEIEGFDIERIYIEPDDGVWRIYLDVNIGSFDIPWLSIDLIKDDRETAELYVKNIYLGNYNLTNIVPEEWIVFINTGISDALLTFNENIFSNRYIQNIELFKESVIIKGILY